MICYRLTLVYYFSNFLLLMLWYLLKLNICIGFVFQIFLNLLGVVIVILVTDITLLIPTAVAIYMFYYVRLIYTRTTGAVKRLEGISKYLRLAY